MLVGLALAAGCAPPPPPDGVLGCPLLVVGDGDGRGTHGALVATPGTVPPLSCVALELDGRVLAEATATTAGTFALQFTVAGDARGRRFELTVSPSRGAPGDRYAVTFSSASAALLSFEPGAAPTVARSDGTIELHAWLAPPPGGGGPPIESVAVVNWASGAVASVEPPPALEVPFVGRVPGRPGECVAAISAHDARGGITGGCWWPRGGGGCCAPRCTLEALADGTCRICGTPEEPCAPCGRARGCLPLVVDERWVDLPPAEREDTVPAGLPDVGPRDAGPPDVGPADVGPPPDAEPF